MDYIASAWMNAISLYETSRKHQSMSPFEGSETSFREAERAASDPSMPYHAAAADLIERYRNLLIRRMKQRMLGNPG